MAIAFLNFYIFILENPRGKMGTKHSNLTELKIGPSNSSYKGKHEKATIFADRFHHIHKDLKTNREI